MATDSSKTRFSTFVGDDRSPEDIRRQFIEAPLDANALGALGSVMELAKVLTRLPDAFVGSQKRELQRVKTTSGENDPRIAALQASIDQSESLRAMASKAQARVQRIGIARMSGERVFHGFVSSPDLTPLSGLTVRLTGSEAPRGKAADTTTDADGYFSISLGPRGEGNGTSKKKRSLSVSQRINQLFETRTFETTDTETDKGETDQAAPVTVQILRKSKPLHEDPLPLKTDKGTVYREYIVSEDGSREVDRNEFVPRIPREDAGKAPDLKRAAASKTTSRTRKKASKKAPRKEPKKASKK